MTEASYVESVTLLADGNPNPAVATFHFTPMSGEASATTRIHLAKTQNVVAVAKLSAGAVFMDKKLAKVTIGGCGGYSSLVRPTPQKTQEQPQPSVNGPTSADAGKVRQPYTPLHHNTP